jgi:hypothetical protein
MSTSQKSCLTTGVEALRLVSPMVRYTEAIGALIAKTANLANEKGILGKNAQCLSGRSSAWTAGYLLRNIGVGLILTILIPTVDACRNLFLATH